MHLRGAGAKLMLSPRNFARVRDGDGIESRFARVKAITVAESSNDIAKTAMSLSGRWQVLLLFDRELIPSYGWLS